MNIQAASSSFNSIGVIGGSGVYHLENLKIIKEHDITTPFGKPSCPILEASLNGVVFYFLARHGKGHVYLPSEVNYAANIYALKTLGVRYLVSVSAVGSLAEDKAPGDFVLPNQFIDWTKGYRRRSFFGEGMVGHVSNAEPIHRGLKKILAKACEKSAVKYHSNGTYICIEGPQFSSRAESELFRGFGSSIIGMTNVPEAFLAKEAGMAYATIAMVTDYDCWKDEACSVEDIMNVMKKNYESANRVLTHALELLAEEKPDVKHEALHSLMTGPELLTKKHREILDVILK